MPAAPPHVDQNAKCPRVKMESRPCKVKRKATAKLLASRTALGIPIARAPVKLPSIAAAAIAAYPASRHAEVRSGPREGRNRAGVRVWANMEATVRPRINTTHAPRATAYNSWVGTYKGEEERKQKNATMAATRTAGPVQPTIQFLPTSLWRRWTAVTLHKMTERTSLSKYSAKMKSQEVSMGMNMSGEVYEQLEREKIPSDILVEARHAPPSSVTGK